MTRTKRAAWESPAIIAVCVIWLAVLLLTVRALRIEAANDAADTAAHVAAISAR